MRHHHPHGPGRLEQGHEVLERVGAAAAGGDQARDGLAVEVEAHDVVPGLDEARAHAGSHPAESDQSELHLFSPVLTARTGNGTGSASAVGGWSASLGVTGASIRGLRRRVDQGVCSSTNTRMARPVTRSR